MNSKLLSISSILGVVLICISLAYAAEPARIQLPQPQMDQARPLMQALKERKTAREFSDKPLPMETLSNLLWAACGINRPESGRRTAPSAYNRQEIDVYVVTSDGVYLYDPKAHSLTPILAGDIRAMTGRQNYVRDAGVNLIYVADFAKMGEGEESEKVFTAAADTGFISQNVYLYCASEGLATAVRVGIDREKLATTMKLRPDQKITLAQAVGYPKPGKQ